MGLTYHFTFKAPAATTSRELEMFLQSVETEAKGMGFAPTMVLNADFDTSERKQLSRRLTSGLLVEDARLKSADIPNDGRLWHLDTGGGACRVPPSAGVMLVVSNELRQETIFGFLKFPETVKDARGSIVVEAGLKGAWWFGDHIKSPDRRYREIVRRFRDAGFLAEEFDEFK